MERTKTDIHIDAAVEAAMMGHRVAYMASTKHRADFIRREIYDRLPDKSRAIWVSVIPVHEAPPVVSGRVIRDEGWATTLTPEQIDRVNMACVMAETFPPKE